MPGIRNAIALAIVAAIGFTPVPATAESYNQREALERALAQSLFGQNTGRVERRQVSERSGFRLGPEPRYRSYRGTVRPYKPYRSYGKKYGIKKRPLPDRCRRWVSTGRGDRLAYSARCLDRNYRHASKLPGRCETLIRTSRGYRAVYGARCLRRDGWRVSRH